ncbi:hypothetical protein ACH4PU_30820 [Streptomyces sp. NPDC021100]|uniref:hypothetical protein n=1 Tax=Streptomyces sp. NPDC021100 TaxID=3365114 RepID=UPI0037A94A3C
MNRSLTRRVIRAWDRTPRSAHPYTHLVAVELTFPEHTFADAPDFWSPGPGFAELLPGSWLCDNGDGTWTGVVAGVGPKELPGADGGPWAEEEVWTVTSADRDVFAHLDDKPHRITWTLGRADVEILREPYAAHPQAAVDDYWHEFYRRFGFRPDRHPDGRYTLTLACAPNSRQGTTRRLTLACGWLMRELGARASVCHVTDPGAREYITPPPVALADTVACRATR